MSIRTKICLKRKRQKKKSCFFVVRDKRGRIIRWSSIGRSTRIDTRVRAKRTVKKGQRKGHLGDIR